MMIRGKRVLLQIAIDIVVLYVSIQLALAFHLPSDSQYQTSYLVRLTGATAQSINDEKMFALHNDTMQLYRTSRLVNQRRPLQTNNSRHQFIRICTVLTTIGLKKKLSCHREAARCFVRRLDSFIPWMR